MEEIYITNIKEELDSQVIGKEKWLTESSETLTRLSTEIKNLAIHSNSIINIDLFVTFERLCKEITELSCMITLPLFILKFAGNLLKISDYSFVKLYLAN